jgi:hypothetical protein
VVPPAALNAHAAAIHVPLDCVNVALFVVLVAETIRYSDALPDVASIIPVHPDSKAVMEFATQQPPNNMSLALVVV